MLDYIKKLFGITPKEAPVAEVPYKIETPVTKLEVTDQATEAVVTPVAPVVEAAPVVKKSAPAKPRKSRKPRVPKAAK